MRVNNEVMCEEKFIEKNIFNNKESRHEGSWQVDFVEFIIVN